MSDNDPTYSYERVGQKQAQPRTLLDYRPSDLAHPDACTLLSNLGVPQAHVERVMGSAPDRDVKYPEARRLLMRWATDVPLNVAWYEQRLRYNRWYQGFATGMVLVLGVALLTLTAFTGLLGHVSAGVSTGSGIALAVTFVLALLQLVANLTDRKARIGAFWKASADLQERLHTFEERWRGKAILERVDEHTDRVAIAFTVALTEEIAKARTIAREERTAYFATLVSPGDVLSTVRQGISAVKASRSDYEAARQQEQKLVQLRGEEAASEQAQVAAMAAQLEAKRAELAQLTAGAEPQRRARLALEMESLRLDIAQKTTRLDTLLSA